MGEDSPEPTTFLLASKIPKRLEICTSNTVPAGKPEAVNLTLSVAPIQELEGIETLLRVCALPFTPRVRSKTERRICKLFIEYLSALIGLTAEPFCN